MAATPTSRRRNPAVGMQPLSPQRKWRAIMVATLVLVPAFWALLAGLVGSAADDSSGTRPHPRRRRTGGRAGAWSPSCSWRWRSCPSIRAPPAPWCGPWAGRCSWGSRCRRWPGTRSPASSPGWAPGGSQALRMDDPQNWRARAWAVVVGVGVHAGAGADCWRPGAAAGAYLPAHGHRHRRPPLRAEGRAVGGALAPEQVGEPAHAGMVEHRRRRRHRGPVGAG